MPFEYKTFNDFISLKLLSAVSSKTWKQMLKIVNKMSRLDI